MFFEVFLRFLHFVVINFILVIQFKICASFVQPINLNVAE